MNAILTGALCEDMVPPDESMPYLCVTIRNPDRVRVQNAPDYVISNLSDVFDIAPEFELGIADFKLDCWAFNAGNCKENATYGKQIILILFDCMCTMGYELIVSSDLTRTKEQSTLFFHSTSNYSENMLNRFICLSPGGNDRLIMMGCNDDARDCVKSAISSSWPKGIDHESMKGVNNEEVFEIKLNGKPWDNSGEDSVNARRLILSLIQSLGESKWHFYAGVNLKGDCDSLFFVKQEQININYSDLMMLSFDEENCVRFINFPQQLNASFKHHISDVWELKNSNDEKNYYGASEFQFKNSPWKCSGVDSINARYLVMKILSFIHKQGFIYMCGLDISRSIKDKSVVVFRKMKPLELDMACISLTSDSRIRFLGMPKELKSKLMEDLEFYYQPGIEKYFDRFDAKCDCYEVDLNLLPWEKGVYLDTTNLHARRLLLRFIETAAKYNWQVFTSLDLSGRYEIDVGDFKSYSIGLHSWFLCFDRNETAPTYSETFYPFHVGNRFLINPNNDPPQYVDI